MISTTTKIIFLQNTDDSSKHASTDDTQYVWTCYSILFGISAKKLNDPRQVGEGERMKLFLYLFSVFSTHMRIHMGYTHIMLLLMYIRYALQILVVTLVINLHDGLLVNFTVYQACYFASFAHRFYHCPWRHFEDFQNKSFSIEIGMTNREKERYPRIEVKAS